MRMPRLLTHRQPLPHQLDPAAHSHLRVAAAAADDEPITTTSVERDQPVTTTAGPTTTTAPTTTTSIERYQPVTTTGPTTSTAPTATTGPSNEEAATCPRVAHPSNWRPCPRSAPAGCQKCIGDTDCCAAGPLNVVGTCGSSRNDCECLDQQGSPGAAACLRSAAVLSAHGAARACWLCRPPLPLPSPSRPTLLQALTTPRCSATATLPARATARAARA